MSEKDWNAGLSQILQADRTNERWGDRNPKRSKSKIPETSEALNSGFFEVFKGIRLGSLASGPRRPVATSPTGRRRGGTAPPVDSRGINIWEFPKMREVPYFGLLIKRILLFGVLY